MSRKTTKFRNIFRWWTFSTSKRFWWIVFSWGVERFRTPGKRKTSMYFFGKSSFSKKLRFCPFTPMVWSVLVKNQTRRLRVVDVHGPYFPLRMLIISIYQSFMEVFSITGVCEIPFKHLQADWSRKVPVKVEVCKVCPLTYIGLLSSVVGLQLVHFCLRTIWVDNDVITMLTAVVSSKTRF